MHRLNCIPDLGYHSMLSTVGHVIIESLLGQKRVSTGTLNAVEAPLVVKLGF